MKTRIIGVLIASTALSGCITGETSFFGSNRVNSAGAITLIDHTTFEAIDLPNLLDPEGRRLHQGFGLQNPLLVGPDNKPVPLTPTQNLERSFEAFYTYCGDLAQRRNRIQDRLIAASNQRCHAYTVHLRRMETSSGFIFGSLTTLLGGAGAIVTKAAQSRLFSGLSGISSGINAEYTKSYFSSLATQVVTPAINAKRAMIMEGIDGVRWGSIEPGSSDGLRMQLCNVSVTPMAVTVNATSDEAPAPDAAPVGIVATEGKITPKKATEDTALTPRAAIRQAALDQIDSQLDAASALVVTRQSELKDLQDRQTAEAQTPPTPPATAVTNAQILVARVALNQAHDALISLRQNQIIITERDDSGLAPSTEIKNDSHPVDIAHYSVERAIGDANNYHSACTFNEGVAYSGVLIRDALSPPGLDEINTALDQLNTARTKAAALSGHGVRAVPAVPKN